MMEILLNPGPVNLSDRVRKALLRPDLCHREVEFSQLQNVIRAQLLDVYGLDDNWAAILVTGSGTAAMEAMVTSMVPADGKLLVVENGVYGERMTRIAGIHGIDCEAVHFDWGAQVDTAAITARLDGSFTHVAMVQHETTTGRLNDIGAMAAALDGRGVRLLLDGVSSFGAEELQFTDWGISACAATANKCLHGVPGTAFVICRRDALIQADVQRTLYLDLHGYLSQQDAGGTPFTQSVQCFYALDEALCEFHEAGGWQARQRLYRGRMHRARQGLHKLGVLPLLDETESSCVLQSFHLPGDLDYGRLHDGLKQRGFIIYAGQGGLAKSIFRISLMGQISNADIDRFLEAMASVIAGD